MSNRSRKSRKTPKVKEEESLLCSSGVLIQISDLWRLTTRPFPTLKERVLSEYGVLMERQDLIRSLQIGQLEVTDAPGARHNHQLEFITWFNDLLDVSNITLKDYEDYVGFGLEAATDINEGDVILRVPNQLGLPLTTEAASAKFAKLIQSDIFLGSMPNVTLACVLLEQKYKDDSKWKHYINFLPNCYTNCLYLTREDLRTLQSSPVLIDVVKMQRNILRQYCYLFKLFKSCTPPRPVFMNQFSYDEYRWAVSTVMTRQNGAVAGADFGLIPLVDMLNHRHDGAVMTYDEQSGDLQVVATAPVTSGDQVYLCYGKRTNGEFLIHNGFVPHEENVNDSLTLQLGINRNSELGRLKTELLNVNDISLFFKLFPASRKNESRDKINIINEANGDSLSRHQWENSFDPNLIAFSRIFNLTEDEVTNFVDKTSIISEENELRAWRYLCIRFGIMYKQYRSSVEEDQQLIDNGFTDDIPVEDREEGEEILDEIRLPLVRLRMAEKRLLLDAAELCQVEIDRMVSGKCEENSGIDDAY